MAAPDPAAEIQRIDGEIQDVQAQATQLSADLDRVARRARVQTHRLPLPPPLHHRPFYIAAGFLAAINVAVWGTTGYIVGRLDDFKIWGVCVSVVLISAALFVIAFMAVLLWGSWRPRGLRHWATKFLPAVSIIGVEVFAIAAIAVYLPTDALVRYRQLKWSIAGKITDSALAPGFALFGNYNDAVSAKFTLNYTECTFPSWQDGNRCPENFEDTVKNWTSSPYGSVLYYTFLNTDHNKKFTASISSNAPQGQQLLLKTNVVWDSSSIGNNNSYNTLSPQNPSLYSIIFDPKMTGEDLKDAINCGMIGWTEQPALGSSTYTIDEIVQTVDTLGIITSQITDPACHTLAVRLYAQDDGYRTYRYHVTSSGTSFGTVCDRNGTENVTQPCTTQILIRVGSFFQTTLTSIHGTDAIAILTDIGGILGAISYIGWFFTIFQ
ncbi:hypothetical protein LTR95_012227 [Oleoguttula sp. CCFEE 5521]